MEDLTDAGTTASIEAIENAISQASAVSAAPIDMDVAQNDVGFQSEPEKISGALLPSSQSQSPFLPANDGQAYVNRAPEIKTEAEISMVDPTGSQAQPLPASTASSAPEKKKYASRPPRLGDSFQAIVPSLGSEVNHEHRTRTSTGLISKKSGREPVPENDADSRDLRPHQFSLRDGLIWMPSAVPEEEVDNYLIMTRGLLEQTSHSQDRQAPPWRRRGVSSSGVPLVSAKEAATTAGTGEQSQGAGGLIPLEADERALFYLYQRDYGVDRASLSLMSELGMGKEYKFLHALDTLYQSGASAAALDRRDRTTLVGSFSSGGVPSIGYSRGARPAQYPYAYYYPDRAPSAARGSSTEEDGGHGGKPEQQECLGEDEDGPVESREKKKRSADKTETRKQYAVLVERASSLWRAVEACRKKGSSGSNLNLNGDGGKVTSACASTSVSDRPRQSDILTIVHEIATLPNVDLPLGDSLSKELDKSFGGLKEVLATSRKFVAKVHDALNTTAAPRSSIDELNALLEELRQQPILLREEVQLAQIIADAKQWEAKAKKSLQDLRKLSLPEAENLITAADGLPLRLDTRKILEAKVKDCRALAEEILSLVPARMGRSMAECQTLAALGAVLERAKEVQLQFPELDMLKAVITRTEGWISEAKVAVSETPDLRKLQSLLEEANTIPVNLSDTCEEIRGKVEQAHHWVEKVRKALPRKNKTRSNAGDAGKVDYSAARTLLSEGAGIRVDVKELDDIAGVLDTAETWLQRVREALEESTDEAGLQSLQALLCEADDIPVEMDEHKILAAEIEARRWGLRVQPRLDGSQVTVKTLEKLVAEAARLRARLPIAAQDKKAWRLPQEIEARRRLQGAQSWLKIFRTCVNSNGLGLRKGVTVRKVLHLLQLAGDVPVDLSEQMRPLEEALAKAERWLESSSEILKSCGIRSRTKFSLAEEKGDGEADTSVVDAASGESGQKSGQLCDNTADGRDNEELEDTGKKWDVDPNLDEDASSSAGEEGVCIFEGAKVHQEALTECVGEASEIGVELPEAESLKALLQRVQHWLDQLGVVCPKRTSKRRGMRLKVSVQEVRDLIDEGKAFPVDVSEEVEEITERLETTLKWQDEVQAELLDVAQEGLRESKAYKLKDVKDGRNGDRSDVPEVDEDDVFNESHENRVKRLETLLEQTSDVGIDSLEDDMISRHLKAHQWASNAIDLLEFVDPKANVTDICLAEIADVMNDGMELLYAEVADDDAACCASDCQQSSVASKGSLSAVDGDGALNTASPSLLSYSSKAGMACDERCTSAEAGDISAPDSDLLCAADVNSTKEGDQKGSVAAKTSTKEFEVYVTEQGEVKKRRLKQKMKKVLIQSHGKCDEVLMEMMVFWWDKTKILRQIWETSREWSKRATRLLSSGGEKVRLDVMEELLAETHSWDFEMELVNRVRAEVERGKNILSRATAALEGGETAKLELSALKSLITEGDKCKVYIEEIKALRKHLASGQRWIARCQKTRPEELDEMMVLAEEAKEIRVNLGEEYERVLHRIIRCCFCRQMVDGPLIRCTECGEKYHQRCFDIREADAVDWERRGWCCPRCLVRWHMRDALAKTMVIVSKWIAVPNATPLGPILPHGQPMMQTALYGMGGGGVGGVLDQHYARAVELTTGKVKAWMKRLLHAVMMCADRNAEEVRTLGTSKLVKGSVLVEVIRLAKGDLDVDKCADVKEVIWNLSVVFWGARLICQLRRRPSLVPLQALTAEMQSVGIHNEPLQVMLNNLIRRALEWIYKAKPILQQGWISGDQAVINVARLRELIQEKRNIPVRLLLERRLEAMLAEEVPEKRYCHCRGFYDGLFMVQCISCNEWFHGRCVQIRAEDLDRRTEYQCVNCSQLKSIPYPYPPYRAPDPESLLAEVDEEEEEAISDIILSGIGGGGGGGAEGMNLLDQDEEIFMADKGSLEGIFPCKKKLSSLDEASNHVDMYLLPLAPSMKRKKLGMGGAAESRRHLSGGAEGVSKKKQRPSPSSHGSKAGTGGGNGACASHTSKGNKLKAKRKGPSIDRNGRTLTGVDLDSLGTMGDLDKNPAPSSVGGASAVSVSSQESSKAVTSSKRGRVRKPHSRLQGDDFVFSGIAVSGSGGSGGLKKTG